VRTHNGIIQGFRLVQRFWPALASEAAYGLWFTVGRPKRVHPREQAVLADAAVSTVRLGRRRVAVYTWGDGPDPVLLVHGWQGRAAEFGEVVRELRSKERTIIAFDAPGHGISSGRRPDLRDFAAVVEALAARYGTFSAVIAHSMGVPAAALAIRSGVRTHGLVVIGGVAEMDSVVDTFGQRLHLNSQTVAGLRSRIERRRFRSVPEVWSSLSAIANPLPAELPLLIIHDRDDPVVDVAQSEALAAAHPLSATTVTTSGLGHHRILRDDAVLDAIGEFAGAPAHSSVPSRMRR
jgi:pimeloyl-ACP methyl ester carboxylesterase